MAWTYEIATGWLSKDGARLAKGYSGAPSAVNDPTKVDLKGEGPLPPGFYTMDSPIDSSEHGPEAIPLVPDVNNNMYERSGFMCHGDNIHVPGTASEGCIIMPRYARDQLVQGLATDNRLQVIEYARIDESDWWETH